nr:hypothetical protein Iba_chr15aCG6810 [Ipomoea batatas]
MGAATSATRYEADTIERCTILCPETDSREEALTPETDNFFASRLTQMNTHSMEQQEESDREPGLQSQQRGDNLRVGFDNGNTERNRDRKVLEQSAQYL